jgi:outer membrane protein TolC
MPSTDRYSPIVAVLLVVLTAGAAAAQSLPRVDRALGMDDAVELALQHNLRLKAAGADARTMDSMRREATAPFWPQASANGYFADQRMAPNVYTSAGNTMARNYQVFNADQSRDANVTLMYPLFSGGRDYYTYRAATRRSEAGREMLRATEVDVAMQARLDYIAAVREAENLRVTEELRREIVERLRVTRETFEAGRVPRFYLLRDETELANVEQMHAMAQSRAEQALVALKTTLGLDLASAVTLAESLQPSGASVSVDEGIREAGGRQPEIRAAVKQREAAEAEVRAAYGNYWPQVSLSYMYDWGWMKNRAWESQTDGMRMRGDGSEGYSVGVVLTLPIFDGFMRENALKTAKSKAERASHAEALARQQVARDVTQTALMFGAAQKAVEASRKGVEQAEEEARVVKERFESGRGIQLEVLDAQVVVTRARFNAVAALSEYHSALAMWLRATGRVR